MIRNWPVATALKVAAAAALFVAADRAYQHLLAPRPVRSLSAQERAAISGMSTQVAVFPSASPDTIVLFVDYRCGYCAVLYTDIVRERAPYAVVIRHVTESRHSMSALAAIAAECSRLQGRFHPFSYALFGKRDSIGLLAWDNFAATAGVPDPIAFSRCVDQRATIGMVDDDRVLAEHLGLPGTPAALFAGRLYVGPVAVGDVIRSRLRLKR